MELRDIPFAPAYKVSQCGTVVYSTIKGRNLTLSEQYIKGKPAGYMYVTLSIGEFNRVAKRIGVHRLVAITWIGEQPDNKPWINHKDGVKGNNHADNLEWCTISENIQHAFDTGLRTMPTGIGHWRHGAKTSKDTKKKMRIAKLGTNHPKFTGWYVIDGVRYATSYQAATALGTSATQVHIACKKKPNKHPNCYFEDEKSGI